MIDERHGEPPPGAGPWWLPQSPGSSRDSKSGSGTAGLTKALYQLDASSLLWIGLEKVNDALESTRGLDRGIRWVAVFTRRNWVAAARQSRLHSRRDQKNR